MKYQEGTFMGPGNISIYHQSWMPEGESKATLLIVHGLAEHSGRYLNLVNHFVPLGYAVYGVDLPGHGRSEGKRVYVKRFEDYMDVLSTYLRMIKESAPDTPVFLIGHSMGGLIGTLFLADHQEQLAGAVISGPLVKTAVDISGTTIFIGKLLSALLPGLGLMKLEADGVSRDPAVVKAYINDPLVYTGKITSRLAAELIKAAQRVPLRAAGITLPILILQGGADRLVDPQGARMLHDMVSSPDKAIKVYDGLFHEVFNEPEHEKVIKDVQDWIEGRVK
jgi:acylglycerol lipase